MKTWKQIFDIGFDIKLNVLNKFMNLIVHYNKRMFILK